MREVKKFAPIAFVLLFCLGAFRLTELSQREKIPVFNYFTVSNLLGCTFDIVHGLLYYIAPPVFYLVFRRYLGFRFWQMDTPVHASSNRFKWLNIAIALLLSALFGIIYYCFADSFSKCIPPMKHTRKMFF